MEAKSEQELVKYVSNFGHYIFPSCHVSNDPFPRPFLYSVTFSAIISSFISSLFEVDNSQHDIQYAPDSVENIARQVNYEIKVNSVKLVFFFATSDVYG